MFHDVGNRTSSRGTHATRFNFFTVYYWFRFYFMFSLQVIFKYFVQNLYSGGGRGSLPFFGNNSKSIGLRLFKFVVFLTYTFRQLSAQSGAFIHNASGICLNAIFYLYLLNLYLDILPVIGFYFYFVVLRAWNIRKKIAQFLHRFLHGCLQRKFAYFPFSLNLVY